MDVKKLVLLVGALLIAGVTAFMARNMFAGGGAPVAQAAAMVESSGPKVLVATKPLPIGTLIDVSTLKFQPWPKDMLDGAYFLKDSTDLATLTGKVVRYTVAAGQPVTQTSLVGPKEKGFLAAALSAGMRAVSVSVSSTSAGGGFIFPGDRVDVMLTHEVTGEGPSLRVTETIVRNVRVIAIDQTTDNTTNTPKVVNTITLEATPKLAEKIAVAQTVGSLSLSLRSIADAASELERAIAEGDVVVGENQDAKADREMEMALNMKPSDANPTFTTGGEVSRFQPTQRPPLKKPEEKKEVEVTPEGSSVRVFRGSKTAEVKTSDKTIAATNVAQTGDQ